MNVKRYEWGACDEHACHCDVVESAEGDMVDYEDYAALEATCAALAAENAGLKSAIEKHADSYIMCGYCRTERDGKNDDVCEVLDSTPATDAFLAEVRAHARNEGINYAAGRLAAAFNHGFVDKPLAEVCDVVHMILDTKEELSVSMIPAVDGLSGEYAEAFLKDSAAQLRKGVQS
ncbi:ead/Ea22-like family protein [Enterobacter hormaechei]|jgi:hypothetical protein|uniref:ead/Ea22-like family protein n=1 Tax=Enterobacter hormaechei TaxID=158836 RepID=UPI002FD7DB4C